MIKRLLPCIAAAALLLNGCVQIITPEPEAKAITLYADFSGGVAGGEIKAIEIEYTGELTVEALAEGLSDWSGLGFLISADVSGDTVTVDWAADSALFAGGRSNDGFAFQSEEARCWFMLDSLWHTVQAAFGTEKIYYTMDGGKALLVPAIAYPREFPPDIEYLGSPFYVHHSGARGEES